MTEMERQVFEPGELFIYRKAPGVYELGCVMRRVDGQTYACWYSDGDTAAHTPVTHMRKIINSHWAPIRQAHVTRLCDILELVPRLHWVQVSDGEVSSALYCFEGLAADVPGLLMGLPVRCVTAFDGTIQVTVTHG